LHVAIVIVLVLTITYSQVKKKISKDLSFLRSVFIRFLTLFPSSIKQRTGPLRPALFQLCFGQNLTLNNHCHAHSSADAHCDQTCLVLFAFHLVDAGYHLACSCTADGVSE
jgi:hypothetical protein